MEMNRTVDESVAEHLLNPEEFLVDRWHPIVRQSVRQRMNSSSFIENPGIDIGLDGRFEIDEREAASTIGHANSPLYRRPNKISPRGTTLGAPTLAGHPRPGIKAAPHLVGTP